MAGTRHARPTLPVISALLVAAGAGLLTAAPFDDWKYSANISFPAYNRAESLTNFPTLVLFSTNIQGFLYSQFGSPSAADLRFACPGSTNEIPYEIERWNTNGTSTVWVSLPVLPGTGTSIRACWGNKYTTTPSYTTNGATWSDNFGAVWHMNEQVTNNGWQQDSTSNQNWAQFFDANSNSEAGADAFIGGGNHLSGSGDYLSVSNSPSISPTNALTVEIMARSDNSLWNENGFLICKHSAFDIHPNINSTSFRAIITDAQGIAHQPNYTASEITNWHSYAVTYDGATATIFFDGQPVVSQAFTGGITNDPGDLALGFDNRAVWNRYLDGWLDEARISPIARSSNWLWACWLTAASNSAFTVFDPVVKTPERGTVVLIR